MAKKAASPATITLKHLAAALSEDHEMSKKAAETILTDLVDRITHWLDQAIRDPAPDAAAPDAAAPDAASASERVPT